MQLTGKEIAANSLEAIPIMATANVAVDFAKDLYKCFVTQSIDTDDLLCNTVNNVFSSATGFAGALAAGQIGGQIAGNRLQASGFGKQVAGNRLQETGCRLQETGFGLRGSGIGFQVPET